MKKTKKISYENAITKPFCDGYNKGYRDAVVDMAELLEENKEDEAKAMLELKKMLEMF